MKILVQHEMPAFHNRIEYVVRFFNSHPLCPPDVDLICSIPYQSIDDLTPSFSIVYKKELALQKTPNAFFIKAQQLVFSPKIWNTASLLANRYSFGGFDLYSVENQKKAPGKFIEGRAFGFDLFETLFFHLSRYEEYHCSQDKKNLHDEMGSEEHFLVREKIYRIPVVDYLVFCFFLALGLHPQKRTTVYRMTHDIDVIRKFPSFYKSVRSLVRLVKERQVLGAFRRFLKSWAATKTGASKDPFDTFDWLFDNKIKERVIYLMAGGKTKYENFYQITQVAANQVIEKAKKKGYSIGIHPSYQTYRDEFLFRKEKEKLEEVICKKVTKSRQHFLRFAFDKTPEVLEKNRIENDSSLGYQDLIGFRCGTGFEYCLYHFEEERACQFWETPMVVMDIGLLAEAENGIQKAGTILFNFLNENRFFTKITFNFHNSSFDEVELDSGTFMELFMELNNWLSTRNA